MSRIRVKSAVVIASSNGKRVGRRSSIIVRSTNDVIVESVIAKIKNS